MENNITKPEEQLIKDERLNSIVEINNSANESLMILKDYSKSLGDKKAPIYRLSNENKIANAILDKLVAPSRGAIKDVIIDVYADLLKLSDHINDAMQRQGNCIIGLSDIIKNVILLESDLYRLLRDTNTDSKESLDAIKNYVLQVTETNEIFECLLTQVYDNVLEERIEKESIYNRFEQIESEQKSIKNQIRGVTSQENCKTSVSESDVNKPIIGVNKRFVIYAAIISIIISIGINLAVHYFF